MDDRLLDKIAEPFNLNLPEHETLEQAIDEFLPAVARFGKVDLTDDSIPMYKVVWTKMSDKPGYTTISIHEFMPSGEIRIANDGAMDSATFKVLTSKRVIIGASAHRDAYLYETAFMDNDFMIFKRHGNQANFAGQPKYLFYCREAIGSRLTWDEALEKMVDKYRNNEFPWVFVAIVAAIIIAALVLLR